MLYADFCIYRKSVPITTLTLQSSKEKFDGVLSELNLYRCLYCSHQGPSDCVFLHVSAPFSRQDNTLLLSPAKRNRIRLSVVSYFCSSATILTVGTFCAQHILRCHVNHSETLRLLFRGLQMCMWSEGYCWLFISLLSPCELSHFFQLQKTSWACTLCATSTVFMNHSVTLQALQASSPWSVDVQVT